MCVVLGKIGGSVGMLAVMEGEGNNRNGLEGGGKQRLFGAESISFLPVICPLYIVAVWV